MWYVRFAFKYSRKTIQQKSGRTKGENDMLKNDRMLILVKVGWWLCYTIPFEYVWIFHSKKWKRYVEDSNILTCKQVEILDTWDRSTGSSCIKVEKEVFCVLLMYGIGQSCCLLIYCSFLRDSLWRSLSFVQVYPTILVIVDWPRDGVLNKTSIFNSTVSQLGHYWHFRLYNFYVGSVLYSKDV